MKNVSFKKVAISSEMLYGLADGEYTVGNVNGVATLALRIPIQLRKGGASAFTAIIGESIEYDGFPNETGFYPVKKGGKVQLAFYHDSRLEFISREFAKDIRLSGGIIDIDADVERKEVMKHLEHLEKEVRKLKKSPTPPKGKKATEATYEEAISDLLDEAGLKLVVDKTKSSGGLKYVPPKDDDDDRLY